MEKSFTTITIQPAEDVLNKSAFSTTSPINIKGTPAERFMNVYKTVGCAYKNEDGSNICAMCDFNHFADPSISDENLERQHEQSINTLKEERFEHFDFLTLGNFFNNDEISPDFREDSLKSLSKIPDLKRVLVESRRQYLTLEELQRCKDYLRDNQTLEFALGYESSNPQIRNRVLKKGVPERHLDETLKICRDAGVDFVSYVLIKPHTLLEREGIEDAVKTAVHVLKKADEYEVDARIAFEPAFVTKGTAIEEAWKKGEYTPPQLWSIIEVIQQTAEQLEMNNTQGKLFVGLSDEGLSRGRFSGNCGECDTDISQAIQDFNGHQNVSRLTRLDHECKSDWEDLVNK